MGGGASVKRFERSNGLDTALYIVMSTDQGDTEHEVKG